MNFGFFGFPDGVNNSILETAEFTSSGSYVIPNGVKLLYVFATSGGGGGTTGIASASGVSSPGGYGAMAGMYTYQLVDVESLGGSGTTIDVLIGSGGAGMSGTTATSFVPGLASGIGGPTVLSVRGKGDFIYVSCDNGVISNATYIGSNSQTSSSAVVFSFLQTAQGQGNSLSGTVSHNSHNGGANGGAVSAANVASAGSSISKSATTSNFFAPAKVAAGAVLTAGGAATGAVGASGNFQLNGKFSVGSGGAGGGASTSGNGGNGGNGYRGGGGGGGGGTRTPNSTGAGGNGGDGYCVIMALR